MEFASSFEAGLLSAETFDSGFTFCFGETSDRQAYGNTGTRKTEYILGGEALVMFESLETEGKSMEPSPIRQRSTQRQ